ncbi:hypothetical protein ITJ66_16415 [Plantibacter sp. VKM Ac-2885]|uniref:helix-turn-helix domain-containing protein n=1 Tax=Plantibacter sp. VKM Ac-2885 TaxID=2783828 RepID=UPI00188AE657|nr:hypothetical protein [Plantibacter sp. VKM Ac-2885]MBF4514070.1 hypothetical protein [Plantibacter sp. VKM Ac-2885]
MDTIPLSQQIAQRVQHALLNHGQTETQLANAVGMPPERLRLKLAGQLDFTVAELDRIAAALGLRGSMLLPSSAPAADRPANV